MALWSPVEAKDNLLEGSADLGYIPYYDDTNDVQDVQRTALKIHVRGNGIASVDVVPRYVKEGGIFGRKGGEIATFGSISHASGPKLAC